MRIFNFLKKHTLFRSLINYLLALAILVSFGNYVYEAFYTYRQLNTYSWLKEMNQVIVNVNEFKTHIKSVEASHRNFLITNNIQYSEAYRKNVNRAYETLEKIEVYALDHPQYQEQVTDLRLKIDEWFARQSATISLRKSLDVDDVVENEKKTNTALLQADINMLTSQLLENLNKVNNQKFEDIKTNLALYLTVRIPILILIIGFLIMAIYAIMLVRKSRKKLFDELYDKNNLYLLNKGSSSKQLKEKEILDAIVDNLKSTIEFTKKIAGGDYQAEMKKLNSKNLHLNQTTLAGELLRMRDILQNAVNEDKKRKIEDEKRNWSTMGMAKISDLLRQNSGSLHALADSVIRYLLNYLDANQGGIYLITEKNEKTILSLEAAYAYDVKKHLKKEYMLGESLVGACAAERQRILITEIPDGYIEISSMLGKAPPRNLMLVPLYVADELVGVIEMASFNVFENYQIEFIENIAQSIASTMISTKINSKTAELLEKSREQAEALSAQEEELRQNLEELQTTQEESARKSTELEAVFDVIDETLGAVEFNTEREITRANYFFVNKLQLKHHETVGKKHEEIIELCNVRIENLSNVWKQLLAGYTLNFKHAYQIEDNQTVWFKETYKPIQNNDGKIDKILAIYIDISDAKEQEIRLKRQTRQMQATQETLTKNMNELKVVRTELEEQKERLEEKNNMLYEKQEELKDALLKAKEAEIEAKSQNENLKKQEEIMQQNMNELLNSKNEIETKQEELEAAHKKLKEIDKKNKQHLKELELREKEIKRHNIELIRSGKLLNDILNSIPLAVFWKNTKLQYMGCNMKFVEDSGFDTIDDILMKTDFDMPWVQYAEKYRAEDKKVIESKVPKENYQKEVVFAGNKRKWINISKFPLFDEHQKLFGVLGVFEDISEYKEKEKEMKQILKKIQKKENND